MGETLSNWILFIASMVFIVGFFRLTGWRPLGWIFIVIGWQRLVFYVRWLIYSRRYDKVHTLLLRRIGVAVSRWLDWWRARRRSRLRSLATFDLGDLVQHHAISREGIEQLHRLVSE
jgi:hypothetical protein